MRLLILACFGLCSATLTAPSGAVAEEDLVHVSSHIAYEARPDQGPVRVSWDLSFQNNDPGTSTADSTGTVFFYENVTVPVLRGASKLTAVSSSGTALDVSLEEVGPGPAQAATISFEENVFFGETYDLHLAYELADVRFPSLLVTPTYLYLPVIAGGDEATVTVSHTSGDGWSVSLEAAECAQDGETFACRGNDSGFLAAILEVSRPDAVATIPFDIPLLTKVVHADLSYFLGEEGAAQHLRELTSVALPLIEEQYGFAYPGTGTVAISQGGRQAALGYEGLTTCHPDGECRVVVSPAADDVTFIHELAHLWSHVYAERWLSEGFAQTIAEETAGRMPEGLVQSRSPEREPATVDLRLDDWGTVSSLIGAQESELATENAGYDRSVRFVNQLRFEAGNDALKNANAAIAAGGSLADSRRFLDVLEETSGKHFDGLFAEWVFPESFKPTLQTRRVARDRLASLYLRAAEEGLSEDVPNAIRATVEAWEFGAALTALDEAEQKLVEYDALTRVLEALTQKADGAGLSLPASITDGIARWEFTIVRRMIAEADEAIAAYVQAERRVDGPRSLWERFGLIAKDPGKHLDRAANAFAAGDFQASVDGANDAREMVNDASDTALRRLLVLGLVLALIAAGIGASLWFSQRREKELAEL